MSVFICMVPVCPIRAEAAHKSEQVSQLLFGELCELLERANDFVRIKVVFDGYEGWCQANQLGNLPEDTVVAESKGLAAGWVNEIKINGELMRVPFGSTIALEEGKAAQSGKLKLEYEGAIIKPAENSLTGDLVKKFSYTFINTPYLWGGRSVFGVDCSGFVQVVFNCINIKLQRDAYQQARQGDVIGFLQEAKCGDLAFFDNEAGRITHVGILFDSDTIIHASGKVRVDTIDNFGIINRDTGKRTHNLRVIKRMGQ